MAKAGATTAGKVKVVKGEKKGFSGLGKEDKDWINAAEEAGWLISFDSDEDTWSAVKESENIQGQQTFIELINEVERIEEVVYHGNPFSVKAMELDGGADTEDLPDGMATVDEDIRGNRFLPGTEPLVVKELDDLIRERVGIVREHKRLTARIVEINEDCLNAYIKHKDHFITDEETGKEVYTSPGGGTLRIRHVAKDKVETSIEDPDED